jgi:Ricin-type beta-trefoil lectin domain-like
MQNSRTPSETNRLQKLNQHYMKTIKNFLNLFLLAISLASSVAGYSQTPDTTKFYVITNMVLGERLAMTGMVHATLGNTVMLRSTTEHPMQQWILEQGKYGYRIYCREHGKGYSLEVVNQGSNSTKISLGKTMEGSSNQTWRINLAKDGSYRLVSLWQNKAIDYVKTGERMNQLTLTEIESSIKSQTWRLVGIAKPKPAKPEVVYAPPIQTGIPVMDTSVVYKLTCQFRGSGFAMEAVSDGKGGTKPMLREAKSTPAQQWKFKFYNTDGGLYRLINTAYTDRSLDIINDGKQNANLTVATTADYAGQFWRVVKNVDNSYWLISYGQRRKQR